MKEVLWKSSTGTIDEYRTVTRSFCARVNVNEFRRLRSIGIYSLKQNKYGVSKIFMPYEIFSLSKLRE